MSRPNVPGNTRRGRKERLRTVGCPESLLDKAEEELRAWVTPIYVHGRWKVVALLSDVTARRVLRMIRAQRRRP